MHRLSLICLLIGLAVYCVEGIPAAVIWMLLGGRTVPDGAVGILPAVMMVVAGCNYVDFC